MNFILETAANTPDDDGHAHYLLQSMSANKSKTRFVNHFFVPSEVSKASTLIINFDTRDIGRLVVETFTLAFASLESHHLCSPYVPKDLDMRTRMFTGMHSVISQLTNPEAFTSFFSSMGMSCQDEWMSSSVLTELYGTPEFNYASYRHFNLLTNQMASAKISMEYLLYMYSTKRRLTAQSIGISTRATLIKSNQEISSWLTKLYTVVSHTAWRVDKCSREWDSISIIRKMLLNIAYLYELARLNKAIPSDEYLFAALGERMALSLVQLLSLSNESYWEDASKTIRAFDEELTLDEVFNLIRMLRGSR